VQYFLTGLGVLLAVLVHTILWTEYLKAVAKSVTEWGAMWPAVGFGAASFLVGALVVVAYADRPWLLLPATIADALGTWLVLRRDRRRTAVGEAHFSEEAVHRSTRVV